MTALTGSYSQTITSQELTENIMKLRDEIECNIIKAKQIYPQVLDLIDKYDNACNIEDKEKCAEIIRQLSILTGKHITENDLFEHWEGDGTEELAFRFCLSEPPTLSSPLLEQELFEIIQRICEPKYEPYPELYEDIPYPKEWVKEWLWIPLNCVYYFPLLEKNLNLPKSFNIRTDAFGDNDAVPIEILEIILKAMK